ncbi:hypothetical protein QN277_004054 [Acacia crassicarpa]|uniref:Uncharacterized protein n=1 Tax=Acacia crassicarpa TaxID=499986 RepID=A0AAE1J2U8_9FABA|nr:hypothetical protein QN277_004054 [Acacia crassicarpa]
MFIFNMRRRGKPLFGKEREKDSEPVKWHTHQLRCPSIDEEGGGILSLFLLCYSSHLPEMKKTQSRDGK